MYKSFDNTKQGKRERKKEKGKGITNNIKNEKWTTLLNRTEIKENTKKKPVI